MNNIYKVIWSKAKNCYVVASEIARSHTKSATGSGKIGGVTRRSLLASLMALSLLCGGLGVASASLEVVDQSGTAGTVTIYTKDEVDNALTAKGSATDVASNTTDITNLKNAVGDAGSGLTKEVADQKAAIAANTKSIDTNKAAIESLQDDKLGKDLANSTFATKDALNDLTTTVNNKADESAVTRALDGKADKADTLAGYGIKDAYTKGDVDDKLNKKADAANVYTKENTFTKDQVNKKLEAYAKSADVYTTTAADDKFATSDALTTAKADLEGKITTAKTELDGKIDANTTKITDLQTKTKGLSDDGKSLTGMNSVETGALKVKGEISNGAGVTTTLADIKASMNKANANETAIGELQATTNKQQTAIDDLKKKTTQISYADGDGTNISGVKIKDGNILGNGNSAITGLTNVETNQINGKSLAGTTVATATEVEAAVNTEKTAREEADKALSNRIGTVAEDGKYIKKSVTNNVSENLKVLDTQAKTNADNIQTNANNIKNNKDEIARVNGELVKTNDYFNTELGKTNNHFNTELGKTNAALQATNKRTAGIERTDTGVAADNQTVIEGKVHFDQNGNVSGVKDLKTDTIHATGEITSEGLDAGSGEITTKGKVSAGDVSTGTLETTGKATIGGNLDVKGTLNIKDVTAETIHVSKSEDNADYKSEGSIIGDGGKLSVSNEKTDKRTNITEKSELNVNEKGTVNWATSTDNATGNVTEGRSEVTADNIKNSVKKTEGGKTFGYEENITADGKVGTVTDKEGNTSSTRQDSKGIYGYAKDKDGNKSYTKQEGNRIAESVIGQDGKQTKSEMTSTDITNTAKDGTITSDAKDIVNKATGNISNSSATMDTTVTGKATESYGELETEVKGNEKHTVKGDQTNEVDGKQINTIKNGQENIISGGQTNTITGGQINNITGDQTTTITGNKKETVTENVTEDYQKDLTTTVGGNENHEVKGTKTETVEGKVTENYKAGQATNVTGDQDITVSGTQTTTATDINRNASSGMIDTIDNDYGTNTETKVAGETKTEVSIKGTGEKGEYIRGATESRDYIIKGTLENKETKTAEATTSKVTDSINTASTKQDAKNLAGSVTNGTETGVSGIHANNDGSVSIDSSVAGGGMSSVINQKKDSIQSAVGDGTNSTVIHQDKDNVTIASSKGMVAIGGKDIVNNAQDTITNTAGTSITNQVKDSKVTTDANGTTFENNTPAVSDGGTTTTKINGNRITTGRVDANELAVSDKDGDNTADFSVKAGEGVKASASNGTTTGSLDVKADEVVSSVKDADGKGSTFKQRINAIMMESKDVSIKAEETLTNEAKVITNRASEVINNEAININNTATGIITSKASEIKNQADKLISNKVGENTWENMEDGKITTSIKNGTKQNLTQSDAEKTEHSVVNGSNSTVNKQTSKEITDAVTNGTTTNVTQNTATSSNNTIADKNGNANTVISTADGTSFINSKANTAFEGGTYTDTTIKGNTITTGKVTMDYAEVMKDLGVTGKTTTGSLEVKGESKLTGKVTMESDAKVGGKLDVTGKATFSDDVDIANNLSVGKAVTAKSYKVGEKTYIDENGIHANGQKITDVADGSISEGSKDAVNGGQLYNVKNDLEGKVNKVGANAAAMANLHPMEFDPDSKWNIAAAIGNYGSETAAALGAFYRPNDDVMVNLSTAFGTGENMVGGGVSVRLGKSGNKLSREESNALKDQVNDLTARMDALLSVLNPNMSKDFPDVPENHWAYEAVSRLAGNDIVQGYPDGEFHGERTMTRYEMAEIIYNALSRGAEAEKELVEEFKPELQAMAASEKATAERAEG